MRLGDLIDTSELQDLLHDFYETTGMPATILDQDGNVLISISSSDMGTDYFWKHTEMNENIRETDQKILSRTKQHKYLVYKYKNGMIDVAIPIIIEGNHLANLLFGQFYWENERPSEEQIKQQTQRYGLDEKRYLEAFRKVKSYKKADIEKILNFYMSLVKIIVKMAGDNLQLKASHELIDDIYHASEAALFIIDVENGGTFRFRRLNPAHEKISGMKSKDVEGKTLEELYPMIPKNALRAIRKNYQKCLDTGHTIEYEEMIPMMGKEVWWLTKLTPLKNPEGKIYRIIGSSLEITGMKKTQHELEKHQSHLFDLAEEKLAESETRFRSFFDQGLVGMAITRPDKSWVRVNRSTTQMLGYSRSELRKIKWTGLLHPEDTDSDETLYHRLLQNEINHYSVEKRFLKKDGSIIYLHLWLKSEIKNNRVENVFILMNDITKSTLGAIDLENALNFNKTIFKKSPVGKTVYDETGQCIAANPSASRLVGARVEDLLRQNFMKIGSWIRSGLKDEAMKILEKGGTSKKEINLTSTFGTDVWLECHFTRFFRHGKPHLLFLFIDISKTKAVHQQLLESEHRLQLATVAANIGVWDWYIKTDEVYFSQQWKRQVGYEDHELKNEFKTWSYLLHPEDYHRMLTALESYLANPDGYFIEEFRLKHKNGSYRWIRNQASSFMNTEGKIERMLGIHTDITKQKQHEENLQNLLTDLERSNKELEQFAYIASHDLQEPLRMVSSFLQLLEHKYGDKIDEEGKEFIHFAVDGAARMKILINDLLTFSRVGTHGKPFVKTNMETVISQVLYNLSHSINASGAIIDTGRLPVIDADESQMIQLFQNLVGNAVKFRGKEPPEITIRAKSGKKFITFSVSDNGIGMDPKFFKRIFVIFQRLHTPDKYPGTGIGLAVCKKITDRHKGEIFVISEPEEGSTFKVKIPKYLSKRNPE